ncbi:cAMP phosphodiesterases class-II-domain-containing protein [Podospora australis]|uniref:cAMP phosphodiesterases class-II-domain-containing protein n=1 Tax=Podospora australis TaxID=1536484 RepID=A0AAN6WWM4_9PEZI|nr:cAMP phosphodiesterases class-II-domain-containing protein [Podospora australis]
MADADGVATPASALDVGITQQPALHVIVLGAGGGPFENNVTSLLVRSVDANWAKGSIVAVDAGVHLGAIRDILEDTQPPTLGMDTENPLPHTLTEGPFAGLSVKNRKAGVNAIDITQDLIDTFLFTHCHLDHIAGFVINTAGLRRPKKIAGLPVTIEGLKEHIFNNVIWPNLTDENHGHGLVTYMRLVEGGSPALGEGNTKGYLEVGDGLAVKAFGVSHGHCIEKHTHRGSVASSVRHGSFDASTHTPGGNIDIRHFRDIQASLPGVPAGFMRSSHPSLPMNHPSNLTASLGSLGPERTGSIDSRRAVSLSERRPPDESICVYDSSAYFFQHIGTGREILVFGDVEPDSESLTPRNLHVWQIAAPKIAAGRLTAIFIECSYDNTVTKDRLYGHLAPRYIAEEMNTLAKEVLAAKTAAATAQEASSAAITAARKQSLASVSASGSDKKRKREGHDGTPAKRKTTPQPQLKPTVDSAHGEKPDEFPVSPRTNHNHSHGHPHQNEEHDYFLPAPQSTSESQVHTPHLATPTAELSLGEIEGRIPVLLAHEDDCKGADEDTDMTQVEGPATPLSNIHPLTTTTTATSTSQQSHGDQQPQQQQNHEGSLEGVLKGLKVVIIHVKERLTDGPEAREIIGEELREHEREAGLGVEYIVSEQWQSIYL